MQCLSVLREVLWLWSFLGYKPSCAVDAVESSQSQVGCSQTSRARKTWARVGRQGSELPSESRRGQVNLRHGI
jgi:hypothetical protein